MVAVAETLGELVRWAAGILRADLGKSLVVSVSTGLLIWFGKRIWHSGLRAAGREQPAQPKPAPTWPPGDLARIYTAQDLKSGMVVAQGTRMVIVDGGIKQCELGPGTYVAKEVERLLQKHAIQRSGVALQYATTPLEVHTMVNGLPLRNPQGSMKAEVVLDVRIEDSRAEKVLDWMPLRDGVADTDDVQHLIQDKVRPWLQDRLTLLVMPGSAPAQGALAADLEPFLNEQVFTEHGLVAAVRSVTLSGV